jgi:Raf kinase inhibitor-like YbhB/YbcL family protein
MPKLNLGDLTLKSQAFSTGGRIPKRHGGDGDNVSPPLEWTGAPAATKEFAVLCYDPDAPLVRGFTHWVVYGIPAGTKQIPEGQGKMFTEGMNGANKAGYIGPYPPNGHGVHHYFFWVYALDKEMKLKPGLTQEDLAREMDGHVLEQARIVGLYER